MSDPPGAGRAAPDDEQPFRRFPPPPQRRETIREWDRRAVAEFGIPSLLLMENAGAGAARIVRRLAREQPELYPEPFRILCGPGNNGGDGLVVARQLHNQGFAVEVWSLGAGGAGGGADSRLNLAIVERLGLPLQQGRLDHPPAPATSPEALPSGTLVDALFGTGLSRPLRPPYLDWVLAINSSGRPVLALDAPSGLDADSGEALGAAVTAAHTITFAAAKVGFLRGEGPRRCGQVHVVEIGIPRALWGP